MQAGRRMDQRGWVPATAGNISVRLPDGDIAITRSGGHKGFLDAGAVMAVGADGVPLQAADRPSAETLLHCMIYRGAGDAGAVLHGHSVAGTVLSMAEPAGEIGFAGYELFKAFAGQRTHDVRLALPLFDNDQDMARLAEVIAPRLADCPLGFYLRGHGGYVWAPSMEAALARLEALEFLLECELARRSINHLQEIAP